MAIESEESLSLYISRRHALFLGCAAALLFTSACKTALDASTPRDAGPVNEQLMLVQRALATIARREPNLPGVRSLAAISRDTLGMSADDELLLGSALYLDIRARLTRTNRRFTEEDVRRVLSSPIDLSPYDRGFYERTLADARNRVGSDNNYHTQMMLMPNDPFFHGHCEDLITGETVPCSRWVRAWVVIFRTLLDMSL